LQAFSHIRPTAPEPASLVHACFGARLRIILALIAKGLTNSAIAERLGLSGKTVANYVSVILAKIDAADRNEARQKVTSLQTDPVGRC
jgi:DNA-binding NarL/FixJ family response regulator